MGIKQPYHRKGLGEKLIRWCEEYCKTRGIRFLTVKTLADLNPDESYAKTRAFYRAMGFVPIEVFLTLWDERNPCLFMIKAL
jgi:GNAT superfamily N-acetyltransferase